MVLEENGLKLARIAAIEAIEVVEAEAARPVVKGTDFTGFPRWGVVILAYPRRRVAVLLEDFSHSAGTFWNDARVAVVPRR